jgi:hypothetical protein
LHSRKSLSVIMGVPLFKATSFTHAIGVVATLLVA